MQILVTNGSVEWRQERRMANLTQSRRDAVIHTIARTLHTFMASFSTAQKEIDPLGISHGDAAIGQRIRHTLRSCCRVLEEDLRDDKAGEDMMRFIDANMGGKGVIPK